MIVAKENIAAAEDILDEEDSSVTRLTDLTCDFPNLMIVGSNRARVHQYCMMSLVATCIDLIVRRIRKLYNF